MTPYKTKYFIYLVLEARKFWKRNKLIKGNPEENT
jgi:hypothetical protein